MRFMDRRLVIAAMAFVGSVVAYVFRDTFVPQWIVDADRRLFENVLMAFGWYSAAYLLARLIGSVLQRKNNGRQRIPKLLYEMIVVACFVAATVGTVAMWFGQTAGGALASSGLIIAVLGFAIRNILADVLGGIALGLEAPFRIGDWIEIDGEVRGKVIEIGWRTTRVKTRNDIYMILPNSEISRKRVTNFSAPKKHYRAKLEIVLPHAIPVTLAKELLKRAANANMIMLRDKKADVRALSYGIEEVRYLVRYWVPSFVDETDCRDAIISAIDAAMRESGLCSPIVAAKENGRPSREEPEDERTRRSETGARVSVLPAVIPRQERVI